MPLTSLFPHISSTQQEQMNRYAALIHEWNQRINLVSRKDVDQLWPHHIWPSVIALKIFDFAPNGWVVDLGSGGGLPAIPLKILRPDLQVLMIDSVRKKVLFLNTVIEALGLQDITASAERAEQLGGQAALQRKFDYVTARAVGRTEMLLDLGAPFLKDGGQYLFWKGSSDMAALQALDVHSPVEVLAVPAVYHHLSPKFSELRWFHISA